MKKVLSKALAITLILPLLLSCVSLEGFTDIAGKVFASEASDGLILDTDDSITRVEWLHNLAVVFEMEVEDELYPDNYFADLESDNEYYYDVLLNVNFGVIDIEAGGEIDPDGRLTRSFAASTLNYCLGYQTDAEEYSFSDAASCEYPDDAQIALDRDWFSPIDGGFCDSEPVSDSEVSFMMEDAAAELEKRVIEEKGDYEFTFHESVIDLTADTEIMLEDNMMEIMSL